MPKRKISSGAAPLQQLDCSDGAKMLIDQMKQHPEEFKGYAGKFTSILDMARETSQGLSRNVKMSQRDAAAIMAAAETHLYEVWLAEDVLTKLMAPKEEPVQYQEAMRLDASGNLGIGIRAPGKSVLQGAVLGSNNITAQYEQAHQRLLEEQRMKALERQESKYAMLNTKPFGSFI